MNTGKRLWFLNSSGVSTPWWLGNGTIPESTNYTIYSPIDATSLSTSKVNLANPGVRDATAGVNPTHAQGTGWTFNGTTQWLNTNTQPTQNSTIVIWSESSTGGAYITGQSKFTPTRVIFIRVYAGVTSHEFQFGPTKSTIPLGMTGGVFAVNSNGGFCNGELETTLAAWSGANNALDMYIGCQNSGGPANFDGGKVFRYAIYDFALSEAQLQALFLTMYNYNAGSINAAYKSSLLALNPVLLYPCNESVGSVLRDHSGNNFHAEAYGCTVGNPGYFGNAVKNNGTPTYTIRPNYNYIASNPDMNELTVSCILTINSLNIPTMVDQVRIFETHHAATVNSPLGDYIALEMRGNNQISIYFKEDGVTLNSNLGPPLAAGVYHILLYNSLSGGVAGIFINGTKYEIAKVTAVGFTGALLAQYPYFNDESTNLIEYIALYDYKLSDVEVDSINPI